MQRPRDNCGICGVVGTREAARLTCFGLHALQHRGRKGAGLISYDDNQTRTHKGIGLVSEIFAEENLCCLTGDTALGHVLDTTSGDISMVDIQPFTATHRGRTVSVAHNGSITNIETLRNDLRAVGAIFHSDNESEIIVHLLARCRDMDLDLDQALQSTFSRIKGAFSMLLLVNDTLVAIRDPHGFRPLCLGLLHNGGYIIASETCALDLIGAQYLRDIKPGEVLLINSGGLHSFFLAKEPIRFCIIEQVYFARPDSTIFGINVYQSRKRMGEALARECRPDADLVMPFSDSGTYAALGYARAIGLPFEMGFIHNHYAGRTFMHSDRTDRALAVSMKPSPVRSLLYGKRVIIVDDSAISSAAVSSKVLLLRKAGVRELHLLVSCPPIRFPCDYGIHFPASERLFANHESVAEIRDNLGLDTLYYLSLEGMLIAAGGENHSYCAACMDSETISLRPHVPGAFQRKRNCTGCARQDPAKRKGSGDL